MGLFGEDTSPRVKIHLEQASYIPGQLLVGHVRLTLVKSYRFTEVLVNFKGFRESQFKRTVGSGKQRQTHTYNEKQVYFRHITTLYKQAESEEKLAVGEHLFPFSFPLPYGLLDSFEVSNESGGFARIRYAIKLEITNPALFRPTIYEVVIFPIYNPFVGQHIPIGLAGDSEVSNWFCCATRGTVHWSVHLRKSCWMAGEALEMTVSVDNRECQVPIDGLYAELKRLIVVTPGGHRSEYRTVQEQLQFDRLVDIGKEDTFTVTMPLSKGTLSTTEADVFTCTYKLSVCLKVPRSFDPEIKIPIRICQSEMMSMQQPSVDTLYSPPVVSMDYLQRTAVFADEKRPTPPPSYSHQFSGHT